MLVYKNLLLVKIVAVLFVGWIFLTPVAVSGVIAGINSVALLRYQLENWSDVVDLSSHRIYFAVNALDSIGITALSLVTSWCTAIILEILTLANLVARVVR